VKRGSSTSNDGGGSDFDGTTNGSCVAHLMLCLNNNDPRLTSGVGQCQSPDIKSITIKSPRPDSRKASEAAIGRAFSNLLRPLGTHILVGAHVNTIQYNTALTTQDRCLTTYLSIPIKNGRLTRQTSRLGTESSSGTRDADTIKISCNP
jgi:hypothetical protein